MDRWHEALEFAHAAGIAVAFNLNVLQGRWKSYTTAIKTHNHTLQRQAVWDSTNAHALMTWTVANVSPALWPKHFGLGNELQWFLTPEQWAEDFVALHAMIQEIFTDPTTRPSTYGPCNAGVNHDWSLAFLSNITSHASPGTHPLGAFTYHGYQHHGSSVDSIAMMSGGIDASKVFFETVEAMHHSSTASSTGLWITETAWSGIICTCTPYTIVPHYTILIHYTHPPSTIHHTPYTIHHTPYTIHHTPYTIHHTHALHSYTIHNVSLRTGRCTERWCACSGRRNVQDR
jgi:hypothetical protein